MRAVITLLFLSGISTLFAREPLIKSDFVKAEQKESLEGILKEQVGVPDEVLYGQRYLNKIEHWNPHLEAQSIPSGEEIYVELPYRTRLTPRRAKLEITLSEAVLPPDVPLQSEFAPPPPVEQIAQARPSPQTAPVPPTVPSPAQLPPVDIQSYFEDDTDQFLSLLIDDKPDYALSMGSVPIKAIRSPSANFNSLRLGYLLSAGAYDQQNLEGVKADTQQSSPGSLLIAGLKQPTDHWGIIYGAQATILNPPESDEGKLKAPLETNLHLAYALTFGTTHLSFSPFIGLSRDQFSTFNISELNLGFASELIQHTLHSVLFGTEIQALLSRRPVHFKLSYATGIQSSVKQTNEFDREKLNGSKLEGVVEVQGSSNWWFTLLARRQILQSPSESLNVTRLGLGLTYRFY
jgi:hypothetical protein